MIKEIIKLYFFKKKWNKIHKDSGIIPMNIFPIKLVDVGKYSYGELNIVTFNEKTKLKIGNFVSIAQHVSFLLDVEHPLDHISTYPFKVKILKTKKFEAFSKGDIIVDDDVWIGYGAIIMSGVHIGQGAVIAAGAVVTKNVPPYAIVGGVPAKIIKYRFDENTINKLLKIVFSKMTKDFIDKNIDILYKDCFDENDINIF